MLNSRDILVATTNSLEGYAVSAYMGVVSSHVVAGANLFSDVFASFSDIFGGRSSSYKRQLSAINDEVLAELKEKARSRGANCILGLSIDHDEVSGGGKSMFMVTATGTAAKLNQIESASSPTFRDDGFMGADEVNVMIERQKIAAKGRSGRLTLDDKTWEFILKHGVHEVAPSILASVSKAIASPSSYREDFLERAAAYFHRLERHDAIAALYEKLLDDDSSWEARNFARKRIAELNALDMGIASDMLAAEWLETRKQGMLLLIGDKELYTQDDVSVIRQIKAEVNAAFSKRGKVFDKQKHFSSETIEKWECECGQVMSMEAEHCSKCDCDIYGFRSDEIKPLQVEVLLEWRLSALETRYNGSA